MLKIIKKEILKYVVLFFASMLVLSCDDGDVSEDVIDEEVEEEEGIVEKDGVYYIDSIEELTMMLDQSDVSVVMEPGVYEINQKLGLDIIPNPILFEFTGNNTTFDFTGVTFEFDTQLFVSYGSAEFVELRLYGDYITLKNLTMVDVGNYSPSNRARAIHLDGKNNVVDGFHITTKGSYPYGYGDLFGKGGGSVIAHRKHSGILIRGENNTLQNTNLYHRAYGHGIFIQGGKNVLVDNCYVEGDEMRTTDDVLLEEGTGSAADDVNFLTVWGYKVPAGYMFSKQEDGIRTYAGAALYSNDKTGADTYSDTENITIKNCTVKNMRSGYSFAFGTGDYLIENCASIENENGFSVIAGAKIVNCRGDAKYGSVYANAYNTNRDVTAEIEILNSDDSYGPHPLVYIGGNTSDLTFTSEESNVSQDRSIQLGGDRLSMRMLEGANSSQNNHTPNGTTVINNSKYPVLLTSTSISNNVSSCGTVTNYSTSNTVSSINCDE